MKNLWTFFSITLMVLLVFSTSTFAGNETIVDEVLMIPKTGDAPVIDGQMDEVWNSVTAVPMVLYENIDDTIGVYKDHFASFRAMWDDDNFYVFVSVVDDELDGSEKASPWSSDCVELFFDGGNEKAGSYDANDIQWRYVYGETPSDTGANKGSNGPGNFAFYDTPIGFNLEIAISKDTLASRFDLVDDTEIGFEISNADRDAGVGQETVLHWWTSNGLTWNDASLFGTALLTGEADELSSAAINIQYTDSEPTIDGDREDIWDVSNELSLMKLENDASPDTIWNSWKDHMASYWTMWDANNFYVFVSVIDDELDGSEKASPWSSDCVELFFDGGNEKAGSYDANDIQWRYVYGETPSDTGANKGSNGPGDFVFKDTDLGFNLEIAISKDTLASRFPLLNDTEIGFEISNADRDAGIGQESVLHWWTTNGLTWNDPSLFGTAVLVNGPAASVKTEYLDVASDYSLGQNYPNPFNPTTNIVYSIANSENVKLTVYNSLGQQVAILVNENQAAGKYNVTFNATDMSSGVYFYELRAGNQLLVNKMMLLK